ncbi:hypothetical protein EBT16_09960, partial [bacterium]|nr:hypothetical protein [bacterium]
MKKQTLFLIVLLVSTCFTLVADEPKNPEAQLSEAGIRRLEGNKQIISKNIETIKTNIQNCQSNVATLEKQEAEISNVESELLKLKDQYESFLSKA